MSIKLYLSHNGAVLSHIVVAFCYVVGIPPRSGRIPTWWESALQSMSANVIVVVRESRGIGRHYGRAAVQSGSLIGGRRRFGGAEASVKAEPGQAGGAPAAGGYVIDTTENTFQAMVQTSATFPDPAASVGADR